MTITIELKGRLGNQLFQYATLRNLSIKKGYNFNIDTNFIWHGQKNLLNYFNIANSSPIENILYTYNQPYNSNYFDHNINNINDNTILNGHFENIEYFDENKDIIQHELTIKDENINNYTNNYMNELIADGSKIVGIHFRRGDLVQQVEDINIFNDNVIKFVNESLETIVKSENKIKLLIFTGGIRINGCENNWKPHTHDDDIQWVNNFVLDNKTKYKINISPGTITNNELIDYNLLSNCDYLITPYESTFSFMAYYVNKKIIKLFSPTNLYCKL